MQPLFLDDHQDDGDTAAGKDAPAAQDEHCGDLKPSFSEELFEEFSRLEDFDEDGAPRSLDNSDGQRGPYARGPMTNAQKQRIWDKVAAFDRDLESLAEEFNRPLSAIWREARVVMKFTRAPNLFNLFVKRWCLENAAKTKNRGFLFSVVHGITV